MASLLALEWDQFEARIVVAQPRGEAVHVEHAFVVSLAPRDASETFADTNVGERLQAALAARRIGRVDTIVAVGRSNIELRRLTLPPAPDEELPEMVRFQAMPQFSNLGDDWPLDYFKLTAPGEGQSVLAAAISPQLVEQIQSTCKAAGLTPNRLILRPCAAASLVVQRGGPAAHRIRLLVDMLAEEADLTVLVESDIVLMRTVRLPAGSANEQVPALLGEIRRTIAAAQNQLGGQRVEEVVLCGIESDHQDLAAQLSDRLNLETTSFDPFAGLSLSSELRAHPPQQRGRFAPLLGMVLDEATARPHAIDFLNPRKRPSPPSRRRVYVLAGAVAGLLALSLVLLVWMRLASLQNQRDALAQQSLSLDEDVERAQQLQAKAAAIDVWQGSHVDWLEELASFSSPERFPVAEDAMLVQWRTATRANGGGQMSLEGRARESSVIPEMEELLRNEQHTVKSGVSLNDKEDARYPWRFDETVEVAPADAAALEKAKQILKETRGRGR
jgi:Tfp pilus assembly PilM family ATPase